MRLQSSIGSRLFQNVRIHELGHLEHGDGSLTAEDRLELVVSIDLGLDLRVLQAVLLDIRPELFGKLRAGKRLGTNDGGKHIVRLDGFHERSVRFTGGFFSHGF